jgi:hypothetical protein
VAVARSSYPTQALTLVLELLDGPGMADRELISTIQSSTAHLTRSLELMDRLLRLVSPGMEPGLVKRERQSRVRPLRAPSGSTSLPSRSSGDVEVTVSDDAPGVAPELRRRLFEPFVTTKHPIQLSALGLAVARELVGKVGGTLDLVPTGGRGACFRMTLRT